MSNTSVEGLRLANADLRAGLARLRPDPNTPWLLKAGELSELHAVILRAGNCRRDAAPDVAANAELEKEVSEYLSTLEEIAKILPSVQGRLLAEKARLQSAQSHVSAISAWAQANSKTL